MRTKTLVIEDLLPPKEWTSLSPDIRRRFGASHGAVVYRGVLVLRRSWLGAIFAWIAAPFGGPLLCREGEDIETEVHVRADERGGVVWERWLLQAAGHPANCVRSTKSLGRHGGLEERTAGGLGMELDVFASDGALVFQSRRYFLQCGREMLRLTIPAWATPGTCRVTHTSLSAEVFRFTLEMRHPIWGVTFWQRGLFIDPAPGEGAIGKTQEELV